ncbi:MAG TPA: iron ABC transporter permease, partial [Chloroflexota bacterium]
MAPRAWLVVRPRGVPLSLRLDRRVPGVLAVLGAATLAGMVVAVGHGEYSIAPLDVARTLLGLETGNPDHAFIVTTLRLPRALVAWMVGVALATSGAMLQGLLRNPLASPEIVGVSAGANLAAVSLIVLWPGTSVAVLPLAAFCGALGPALVMYLVAGTRRSAPLRLVLVGVGVTAIANALTTTMITLGEIMQVSQALVWMAGSVYGRSWEHLWPLLP